MADVAAWHCRIGKVTRKDGRGWVRVLRPGNDTTAKTVHKNCRDGAEHLCDLFKQDAGGYITVMWGLDGRFAVCRHVGQGSPYGTRLAPDIFAAALRTEVSGDVTRGVLRGDE